MNMLSSKAASENGRARVMAKVKSRNTAPELAVRGALFRRGLRYRLHASHLPGTPDIVFPRKRVAVFVHGCFWHGCTECDRGLRRPKTNLEFWNVKLNQNKLRDARNIAELQKLGWRVAVVWECTARDQHRLMTAADRIEAICKSSEA